MEIERVKEIVVRLNTIQKIIGFAHNQYAKTGDSISKYWNTTEYMDDMYANESFLIPWRNMSPGAAVTFLSNLGIVMNTIFERKTLLIYLNFFPATF